MAEIIDFEAKKIEKENNTNHPHMPQKFWTCSCEHCLFYLEPVEESFELICYGCGTRQRWDK